MRLETQVVSPAVADRRDTWFVMDEDGEWLVADRMPIPGGKPGEGVWELLDVDSSLVGDCMQTLPVLLAEILHAAAFPPGTAVDWRKSRMRVAELRLVLCGASTVEDLVESAVRRAMGEHTKEKADGGKGKPVARK